MSKRSILSGRSPTVIVKAVGSVSIKGRAGDRVLADVSGKSGLQIASRSPSEVGRARAAIGERVLFDVRLKLPGQTGKSASGEVIEVQIGGSGEVRVPFAADLKVYAGKDILVQGVHGRVDAYSGFKLSLQEVGILGHASAGGSMDLDCRKLVGDRLEFQAGGDLRFHVRELTGAFIRVKELDGYWEARIGRGEKSIYLKCGGNVTLVTDQVVEPLPPSYMLGKIEEPPDFSSAISS